MEEKNIGGEEVKIDSRVVKVAVTARSGQRRSVTQEEETLAIKLYDLGKDGEKGKEVIPLRVVLGNLL